MARRGSPRVARDVRAAIADALGTIVSDPRLSLVTITEVELTPDHEHATVYWSTPDPALLSDDRRARGPRPSRVDEVAVGLAAATPMLRGAVGRRVVAQGLVRAQVEDVVAIGQRHGALRGVRRQDDLEAAVRRRRKGPGLVLVGQLAVHGHALEAPELGRGPRDVADVRAAARLQAVREVADVRHARHEDERAGLGRVAR